MNQGNQKHNPLKLITQNGSVLRATRVAILVGIILNFINNPGLFMLSLDNINIYRVLLTFLVPFFVSIYSSILANRAKCPETIEENEQ